MKIHKASLLVINYLFLLLIFSSSSLAFNITKILSQHKEFQTLNGLLSQTKLADEINRRRTITVLVVDDAGLSPLAGKPLAVVKKILSVHVILDYYDVEKLTKLVISNKITTLTTLFQASGQAFGQQGFVNVSLVGEGEIAFGSAAAGGILNSKLVEPVVAQPLDISVLQITVPVHVPGIDSGPATPPPPHLAPALAPKKSPTAAPAPSPPVAPATSPANAPASDGPAAASDVPTSSPPTPESTTADSEPPAQKTSGGSRRGLMSAVGISAAALVMSYCLAA